MAVQLNQTKDCENWHVLVFKTKHDQDAGQRKLNELGVKFDEFPMGRTVVGDLTEEKFNVFIEPYQENEDGRLIDMAFLENANQVEALADWAHEYDNEPGSSVEI